MARQRRAAPRPRRPRPQQSSSSEESGSDTEGAEELSPRAAAARMPPESNQPNAAATAADGAESSAEEESDSDEDAAAGGQASQTLPTSGSPFKPVAPAPQPESDADEEEEDGESSESEREVPAPVQKKAAVAAAAKKSKTVVEEDGASSELEREVPAPVEKKAAAAAKNSKSVEQEGKKRPAPEAAPSDRRKKARADVVGAASESTPTRKGEKAIAELEKAAPRLTRSSKANKSGSKLEKSGLSPLPQPSKSRRTGPWSYEDSITILKALAAHVRSESVLPTTGVLLAAVGARLQRKDCTTSILYEKVRSLHRSYDKAVSSGVMPSGEDELQIYNLSEAIWGEKAISAAAKSKKGQADKAKIDENSKGGALKEATNKNGDTQEGSKKGQAINGKKGKLSREDAKNGTSKETATESGDALMKHKRGKTGKEKMDFGDESLMPNKASTGSGTRDEKAEDEAAEEDAGRGARVQRSSAELHNLYPSLAAYIEKIKAQHPCGETLIRAFGFITDENAKALESIVKELQVSKVKARLHLDEAEKDAENALIDLAK